MLRRGLLGCTAVFGLVMTSSCGGGGTSGSGSSPAPAPAPAPAPTPTPTPVAPTARAFGASTGPCYAYLYATPDPNTAPEGLGDCARDGSFGPGAGYLRGYGAGTKFVRNYDTSHVFVLGIDSASATAYRYTGPLGSQIYSPLTSVTASAGSQARVKRALGLDGSLFAFEVDRDLTSFDPVAALASSDEVVRRDGARMIAGNLRATATSAALNRMRIGEDPTPNVWEYYHWPEIDYPLLGREIAADDRWLFENARMGEILTRLVPAGRYRADVISARRT